MLPSSVNRGPPRVGGRGGARRVASFKEWTTSAEASAEEGEPSKEPEPPGEPAGPEDARGEGEEGPGASVAASLPELEPEARAHHPEGRGLEDGHY